MENNLPAGFTLDQAPQGTAPVDQSALPPGFQLDNDKYGSGAQGVIGGIEQVAKGALGPLATVGELALGVPRKDILEREKAAGGATKFLGQTAGLIGSTLLPGVGQAKLLSAAGDIGAHALGLGAAEGAGTIAKIGTAAATAAIENAVYEGNNEIAKKILGDPEQTAASAMLNIGTGLLGGGVFGAGIGAVSPLWSATAGPKAEALLRSFGNRVNGEGLPKSADLETLAHALEAEGKHISPEIKAALSGDQKSFETFQRLREAGNSSGDALRRTLEEFKADAADVMANVFHTEEKLSGFEAGEKAKEAIISKADQINEQVSANYDKISTDRESILVPDKPRLKFYDHMIEQGQEFGAVGSPAEALFKTYSERMLSQNTIGQLDKLRTEIFSDIQVARRAGDFEKARALGQIRDMIGEFQDRQIGQAAKDLHMSAGVPEAEAEAIGKTLIKDTQVARKSYADFIGVISDIASSGKLGKVKSYGQLIEALDKIPSAKLAAKLFDPKNVESLRFLKEQFPEVFDSIIKAKKQSLIEMATTKGELMHNKLLDQVNKLPKEIKDLMFTPGELKLVNAAGSLLRKSSERINPSGTAGTWQKLLDKMPAGVGAMAGALLGKNPIVGGILGHAAKVVGSDLPDAVSLAMLKKMGSTAPVDSTAFKASVDYIGAAIKGQKMLEKASKAIVTPARTTFPTIFMPSDKSREKLEKNLEKSKTDQSKLFQIGGQIGYYMPDHAASMSNISMNAIKYLESLKPDTAKRMPMDAAHQISAFQKGEYNRALDIAEQPLLVMKAIGDGDLTSADVRHLKIMYPSIYMGMRKEIFHQIAENGEEPIPYKKRMNLAIFLEEPLDSTMTPQAILANQITFQQNPELPSEQQAQARMPQNNKLGKIASESATPGQAREKNRSQARA